MTIRNYRGKCLGSPVTSYGGGKGQFTVDAIETIKANVSQVVLHAIDDSDDDDDNEKEEEDDNASEGDGSGEDD